MAQSLRFDASTRCIEPQTLEGVLFLVIYFDFMEDTTLHVGQCGPFHKLMGYSVIHIMANMNSIPVVNYYYWNQQNFPVCGISLGLPIPMTTPNYTSISLYQLTWAAQLLLTRLVSTSYVSLPGSEYPMNALPEGQQIGHPNLLQDYEEIFIKVKNWGCFEESDLARNQIWSPEGSSHTGLH